MTLEEHIHEAWSNAIENGYEEWLLEASTIDIAIDMMDCDADIELYSNGIIEDVVVFIDKIQGKYRREVYGNFPEDYHKLPRYDRKDRDDKKDKDNA